MIVKEGSGYVVRSESGKSLGTYASKAEAEARLKQIEMHKRMDQQQNDHMNRMLRGGKR